MKRAAIVVFLLATALASAASAQTSRVVIDEFQVSRWVTENMQALNIPSIAVGIVGPQQHYYLESFGPAELDQPFLIGSLSKSVTAVAVMLLVEEGKVALSDPASKWVPGVPDSVTVEHLLHQTSGLAPGAGGAAWENVDASVDELVTGVTFGPPGTYTYSNLNYTILGRIVAAASGKPYAEFVQERIFGPAKLETATAAAERPEAHVKGQQYMFGFPVDFDEPDYGPAHIPAGFVWMSAQDMARWIRLFVAGGKLDGAQVLPATVIEAVLKKPQDTAYAMGWVHSDADGVPVLQHSGATAAFTSAMMLAPDREFGIFVLTNLNSWLALGPVNITKGLAASILGTSPKASSNLEFVVRLGFGIFTALILFVFLFELVRWASGRFPVTLVPKERNALILTVVVNVVVVIVVTQAFGMSLAVLVKMQPDIAIAFFTAVGLGTLRQVLTGFNKSAHARALAAEDI